MEKSSNASIFFNVLDEIYAEYALKASFTALQVVVFVFFLKRLIYLLVFSWKQHLVLLISSIDCLSGHLCLT